MSWLYIILLLVTVQRLLELVYSKKNEHRLRITGGTEYGANHYFFFFAVHGGWLCAMAIFISPNAPINWFWILVFSFLQVGRIWVIFSLGKFWTTRIITLDGHPLITKGPYRWFRHPNYLIVIGEIASLPMAFNSWLIVLIFSFANGILLWHRIRVEDKALNARRNYLRSWTS